MGIISNLVTRSEQRSATSRLLFPEEYTRVSRSGIAVTPDTAMRQSTVWACIRVLSSSMGALPLHVYEDEAGGGKKRATNHPVYNLLHRAPNPEISAFTYRQMQMVNLCLYGNFYSEIEVDDRGFPIALWPISGTSCEPVRNEKKELFYQVEVDGVQRNVPAYRMLHFQGLGKDGMKGLSPIRQMMETIGISMAAEQFGASFFGNGANVGLIVEHPGKLTGQGSENLRHSLTDKYAGLDKSHRIMLLEEGMKANKASIPPDEAQFLETRQFQVEDIAGRIFGVQLHKIGHLLHATFSNIEHQAIEFVTDTMLPWTVNCEMEYDRKLFLSTPQFYTKHSLEGLLRGDSAARATFYRELYYISAICADEIREKEDMNPLPDDQGKRFYTQANMIPIDKIDQYIAKNGSQPARSMVEAVKRITNRTKDNLLKQHNANPEKFPEWLESYSKDLPSYMLRELTDTEK